MQRASRWEMTAVLLALASAGCGADAGGDRPAARPLLATGSFAQQVEALHRRAELRLRDDPGDLRANARVIVDQLRSNGWSAVAPGERQPFAAITIPTKIRVWRRSLGSTKSCSGRVDRMSLERYVRGVLPHEWIRSWKTESLRAGAIAIRTYAAAWIVRGGKYTCADVDDTAYTQVYKDATYPNTDAAVKHTEGLVLVKSGKIVFAEYSAENGDPTKSGVSDPPCHGRSLFGHGRGMCQWGTQRWAKLGKNHRWMALHYYPGASLYSATARPDTGAGSPADSGAAPRRDSGAPASDAGAGRGDGFTGATDTRSAVAPDGGARFAAQGGRALIGNCSVGPQTTSPPVALVGLLLLGLWFRRSARRRSAQSRRFSERSAP